jgi:hypothetical protein
VGHEHDARLVVQLALAGQVHDQVAGLGRHRDAVCCVIEVDRARRHAGVLQRAAMLAPDRGLLPVTPSTARKRIRRSVAAAVSTGMV